MAICKHKMFSTEDKMDISRNSLSMLLILQNKLTTGHILRNIKSNFDLARLGKKRKKL